MSTDPRVEASKVAILDRLGTRVDCLVKRQLSTRLAQASIAAADKVDREQGIHRVKVDDATVEKCAEVLWDTCNWYTLWVDLDEGLRSSYRGKARAVLVALTGGES